MKKRILRIAESLIKILYITKSLSTLLHIAGPLSAKVRKNVYNKKIMNKFFYWMKESNRWKHLLGGALIGGLSNGWYCMLLAGGVAAGSLELKDKLYGGKWDWVDFGLTMAGACVGYAVRLAVCNYTPL